MDQLDMTDEQEIAEVTDTTSDSSTEQTTTEETPSSEGDNTQNEDNIPFHKHPRWLKREEEWNQKLEDTASSIRAEYEEKLRPLEQRFASREEVEVPSWFGGDESAYKAYMADQQKIVEQAEERAINRIKQETEQKDKSLKEANSWFEDSVSEIESDKDLNPDGSKVDRNKLLKKAMDEELIDSKGRWNYKAAYKMLAADARMAAAPDPDALKARQRVAAATTSESTAETKDVTFATGDSFRGGKKPW